MARRTRAEMEETRATLLATARTFFADRGYADTSMDELTAQAGLTRGALYHHFGDKKGLLAAVVDRIRAARNATPRWSGPACASSRKVSRRCCAGRRT